MQTKITFEQILERLAEHASAVDAGNHFPAQQFEWLAQSDVLKWVIPSEYGGSPVDELLMLKSYETLAEACLTTTFVLTQRNGACQRIVSSKNDKIKELLLPNLALGEIFATVGISHLTTSRQHLKKPSVTVEQIGNKFILNGFIPWVTGANAADYIVTGGTHANGQQILITLPTHLPGISVQTPSPLMALTASCTASVVLEDVHVPDMFLLDGPTENVMQQGAGGAGSLTTSTLALGLCARMLKLLTEQATQRPDLKATVDHFTADVDALRSDVHASALREETSTPTSIRHRINSLALRITQAALAITKGAGFVKGHPVELAVREAMFFLVWSCPQPVVDSVLKELTCQDGW